jgi:hypothetical protein
LINDAGAGCGVSSLPGCGPRIALVRERMTDFVRLGGLFGCEATARQEAANQKDCLAFLLRDARLLERRRVVTAAVPEARKCLDQSDQKEAARLALRATRCAERRRSVAFLTLPFSTAERTALLVCVSSVRSGKAIAAGKAPEKKSGGPALCGAASGEAS